MNACCYYFNKLANSMNKENFVVVSGFTGISVGDISGREWSGLPAPWLFSDSCSALKAPTIK
jgi:hypothetical protein